MKKKNINNVSLFSRSLWSTGKQMKSKLKCLIIETQNAMIPQRLRSHVEGLSAPSREADFHQSSWALAHFETCWPDIWDQVISGPQTILKPSKQTLL